MPKKVTTIDFISKAMTVHGFTYDYSKSKYVNSKTSIEITCKEHGTFNQIPNCHLTEKGCPDCGGKLKYTKNNFIKKAKEVHGDKYNYLDLSYVTSKTKVKIICNFHGEFSQRANNHLQGGGCPICARETLTALVKLKGEGWTTTSWKKAGENSKNFKSFKVYIIKCWNEEEVFYKIGKTFVKLKSRFDSNNSMPYNWEVFKIFKGDAIEISALENTLQIKNKEYKYVPKIKFGGMNECFKQVNYDQ